MKHTMNPNRMLCKQPLLLTAEPPGAVVALSVPQENRSLWDLVRDLHDKVAGKVSRGLKLSQELEDLVKMLSLFLAACVTAVDKEFLKEYGIMDHAAHLESVKTHLKNRGNQDPGPMCEKCNLPASNLRKCGRCHVVWYCDLNYQRADWPEHKRRCFEAKRGSVFVGRDRGTWESDERGASRAEVTRMEEMRSLCNFNLEDEVP